jgi:sugar lactone lactonase YvrE
MILILILAGCQHPQPSTHSAPRQVWPAPPDTARIGYVQSVESPNDLGVKTAPLTRFGRWLTGSDKGRERLLKPFGIALDEQDNLCLTDTGANVVCYFDRAKKKWHRWDRAGRVRFSAPVAIAKRNGIFFVADSALGSVVAFDERGALVWQITDRLQRPSGLAILQDRLYVADAQRHCILIFDLRGAYRSEFGNRGLNPGQFNFPTHITATAAGELFVTDSMNGRIQVFDADGRFKKEVGRLGDSTGELGRPKGVAVDSLGQIYVLDALFDNLQIFDREGRLLLTLGQTGDQPGQFWLPNGIAISADNRIFVADSYNRRLQILQYLGPS